MKFAYVFHNYSKTILTSRVRHHYWLRYKGNGQRKIFVLQKYHFTHLNRSKLMFSEQILNILGKSVPKTSDIYPIIINYLSNTWKDHYLTPRDVYMVDINTILNIINRNKRWNSTRLLSRIIWLFIVKITQMPILLELLRYLV